MFIWWSKWSKNPFETLCLIQNSCLELFCFIQISCIKLLCISSSHLWRTRPWVIVWIRQYTWRMVLINFSNIEFIWDVHVGYELNHISIVIKLSQNFIWAIFLWRRFPVCSGWEPHFPHKYHNNLTSLKHLLATMSISSCLISCIWRFELNLIFFLNPE